MNFYDKVHELVRSFKETEEYKKYIGLKGEIKNDSNVSDMLRNFKAKQQENQMIYINTGKPDPEKQKELENLYSILIQNEKVRSLFETEMKLDVLLADMQKIIGEGIKDIIEF